MSKLIEVYELKELDEKIKKEVISNYRNKQDYQEHITEELQNYVFDKEWYLESKGFYDVLVFGLLSE